MENLTYIYKEIMRLPKDVEWVKFVSDESTSLEISELIPVIAHKTYLAGMDHGYVVWGVMRNYSNAIGTSFKPYQAKKGKQDLITWLSSLYKPSFEFHFLELEIEHKPIVILEIKAQSKKVNK